MAVKVKAFGSGGEVLGEYSIGPALPEGSDEPEWVVASFTTPYGWHLGPEAAVKVAWVEVYTSPMGAKSGS